MKKTNLLILSGTLMLSALAAASCDAGKIKIGILQPVEHEALSAARQGFIDALKEEGFDESKIKIEYRNAGGKDADQNAFAKDLVSRCDMTLGIGTGASKSLKEAAIDKGKTNPVLFTAVTDPVDAGLVSKMENGSGFVTGTSDAQPLAEQVGLIKLIKPDADKVGIIYTQSESNSVVQANQAKAALEASSISVVTKTVTGPSDISATASALASEDGIDAIYVPTDNTIAANTDAIKTAVKGKGILVVCGEESMLKGCGHITLSINYTELGKRTGKMAASILKGEKQAKDIPVTTMSKDECDMVMSSINIADANVAIPDSIKSTCRDVSLD